MQDYFRPHPQLRAPTASTFFSCLTGHHPLWGNSIEKVTSHRHVFSKYGPKIYLETLYWGPIWPNYISVETNTNQFGVLSRVSTQTTIFRYMIRIYQIFDITYNGFSGAENPEIGPLARIFVLGDTTMGRDVHPTPRFDRSEVSGGRYQQDGSNAQATTAVPLGTAALVLCVSLSFADVHVTRYPV